MGLISSALAATGVASSIYGGLKAKDAAKEAAKEQAKFTWGQRQEEIRQRKRAAEQQKGLARAGVYSSNLQMSGSSKRYVTGLDMENMREIAQARHAARQERKAIEAGAQGAGDQLFAQAAGDLIGFGVQSYMNRSQSPSLATNNVSSAEAVPIPDYPTLDLPDPS